MRAGTLACPRQDDGLTPAVRAVLIEREALPPRLANSAAPTLWVASRHDAGWPWYTACLCSAASLPRGRFEVLGTEHISVVDAPAQDTELVGGLMAKLASAAR